MDEVEPDEGRPARTAVREQEPVGNADPAPQPEEEEAEIGVAVEHDLGPELPDLAHDRQERRPLLGDVGVAADSLPIAAASHEVRGMQRTTRSNSEDGPPPFSSRASSPATPCRLSNASRKNDSMPRFRMPTPVQQNSTRSGALAMDRPRGHPEPRHALGTPALWEHCRCSRPVNSRNSLRISRHRKPVSHQCRMAARLISWKGRGGASGATLRSSTTAAGSNCRPIAPSLAIACSAKPARSTFLPNHADPRRDLR